MSNPTSPVAEVAADIWSNLHKAVTGDLVANLAIAQVDRDAWRRRAECAEAKVAELEKKTAPTPEILTPPVPPTQ